MHAFLLVLAALFPAPHAYQAAPAAAAPQTATQPRKDVTWVEVARVVDGDTIHVMLGGKLEKLRLLCVDTEEKIGGGGAASPTKPGTVFGEECALWAQDYFAKLGKDGAPPKIGLRFPPGREQHRDPFGRLLCHVVLPDGTDYNVMIVKLGKSPYFSKYGYSEIDHDAFVAAQKEAREKKLGIWNPETNVPKTPGTPSAMRPYDKLLPWWELRAEAVRSFTQLRKVEPRRVFEAESGTDLAAAVAASSADVPPSVFGEIDRVFDEADGSQTVLFRASVRDEALRVRIPKESVAAMASAKLAQRGEEFQQNYVWYRGTITRDGKGFRSTCSDPAVWRDGRTP